MSASDYEAEHMIQTTTPRGEGPTVLQGMEQIGKKLSFEPGAATTYIICVQGPDDTMVVAMAGSTREIRGMGELIASRVTEALINIAVKDALAAN